MQTSNVPKTAIVTTPTAAESSPATVAGTPAKTELFPDTFVKEPALVEGAVTADKSKEKECGMSAPGMNPVVFVVGMLLYGAYDTARNGVKWVGHGLEKAGHGIKGLFVHDHGAIEKK